MWRNLDEYTSWASPTAINNPSGLFRQVCTNTTLESAVALSEAIERLRESRRDLAKLSEDEPAFAYAQPGWHLAIDMAQAVETIFARLRDQLHTPRPTSRGGWPCGRSGA